MNASCHLVEVCVHYTKIPGINPECAERFNFSVICAKDPTLEKKSLSGIFCIRNIFEGIYKGTGQHGGELVSTAASVLCLSLSLLRPVTCPENRLQP